VQSVTANSSFEITQQVLPQAGFLHAEVCQCLYFHLCS